MWIADSCGKTMLLGLLLGMSSVSAANASMTPAATDGLGETLILKIAGKRLWEALRNDKEPWSNWHYFEVTQTDVCRIDPSAGSVQAGELVRVDLIADARLTKDKEGNWVKAPIPGMSLDWPGALFKVKPATKIRGSANPAKDWMAPEFDDSEWARSTGRTRYLYRGISLMSLRGRFAVTDPAKVTALDLNVGYHGGIVVYMNGKEVGRDHLPAGALTPDTLADDYARDAYFKPDGSCPDLFGGGQDQGREYAEYEGYHTDSFLANRNRKVHVSIPPNLLKKGVNVLALEIHRAPIAEGAITKNYNSIGRYVPNFLWNRCEVEYLTLNATSEAHAIEPNCSIPRGMRVWEQAPLAFNIYGYADACEPPVHVNMIGLRNGVTHGQVMLGSDAPIRKLTVQITEMTGTTGAIPKTAIQLGFPRFEGLEPEPPGEIPKELLWPGVVQPVWITVQIPKNAVPGKYAGHLTVAAEGEKPVEVPVNVEVVGAWVLPESTQFKPYVGLMESPDTIAAQYQEPLWSDAHWAHLDQVFQLMGQIGTKEIHIGLESETHIGNKSTLVYWIKQPDGSWKYDFTIADRYLGLAAKYLGPNVNVCCHINYGQYCPDGYFSNPFKFHPQLFTVVDPKTGALTDEVAPAWGTPESLAFWKPVFDGLHQVMAKHGITRELAFAMFQFDCGNPKCYDDIAALLPNAGLICRSHIGDDGLRMKLKRLYMALVMNGGSGVGWDPDTDPPFYNWREPWTFVSFGRDNYPFKDYGWGMMRDWKSTANFYQYPERTMLCGRGQAKGELRLYENRGGFAHWGADFWPVPIDGDTKPKCLAHRYVHTTGLMVQYLFCPGKKGPIPSVRSEMLREGMQDFEARAFVQDALLDHPDKLGPELAKRCKEVCDDRTRFQLRGSCCGYDGDVTPYEVVEMRMKLYALTDEVAKALGK